MLRTQTQKQSSFYVCASCRRQPLHLPAQLLSSNRPRPYHLLTTFRPLRSSATTHPILATLPTSLRLRKRATTSRHGAPPNTARIDTRGIGSWPKFTFGSPSVPGQSNSAWGPAAQTLPTPGTPSSTSPLPGRPSRISPATGTSAWAGRTNISPPTNSAPSWGPAKIVSPGPGPLVWGGPPNSPLGPGAPTWVRSGAGLNGSGPPAWAPPVRLPPAPTYTKPIGSTLPTVQSSSPSVQPLHDPAVARPPGNNVPSAWPTSPAGLGRRTSPHAMSASGGSGPLPAVSQTSNFSVHEKIAGNGAQAAPPAGMASKARAKNGADSDIFTWQPSQGNAQTSGRTSQSEQSTPLSNQTLAVPARPIPAGVPSGEPKKYTASILLQATQAQPGLARDNGTVSTTPPSPTTIPSQAAPGLVSNPTSGAVRSAHSSPVKAPRPSGAMSPGVMGAGSTSFMPSNTTYGNGKAGAVPSSSGVSGATTSGGPSPAPGNAFSGSYGGFASSPIFGTSPGAIAGKPKFAGPSGWVPRKPAFGGAQDWASKTSPGAFGIPAKTASGNNAESFSWKQSGEMSYTPRSASDISAKIYSKDSLLERVVWDQISVKPPVRQPPAGAEYPQLSRKSSKKDAFESTCPFKLPPKRQGPPVIKATGTNPQHDMTPGVSSRTLKQQHRGDNQPPRRDRVPVWTTSSDPQATDDFEKAFKTAIGGSSSGFPTLSTSQNEASKVTYQGPPSQEVNSDDWDDVPPPNRLRKPATATADRPSDSPDDRGGRRDPGRDKDLDVRSRERDYRGRGKDVGQHEDEYAARDKANRRKKYGGIRKQHTVDEDGADEEVDYQESRIKSKQHKKRLQERKAAEQAAAAAAQKTIRLPEYITVYDLAEALRIKPAVFLLDLEQLGFENTLQDSVMTGETAALVAAEYGFEPTVESGDDVDLRPRPPPDDLSSVPPRPPIVTIMGHVDHGKTTILDTLRKSSIVAQEFGGITQHIGAFSVKLSKGKTITFLDTPGHAAFLSMRQRGANVTDIIVLVVAVDDSVMPQTIEAIKHAQNAKVPMIVAINKIDLDDNPNRLDAVKQDLSSHGVDVEDYGGDVQAVGISGKTGKGMRDLEDAILTLSEVLDVRAETDGMAEGWVLEASIKLDGRAATVLVKRGTLRVGDLIVSGNAYTRVRILRNEAGVDVGQAGPGVPIEVYGSWKGEPMAGDMILQAPDETKAQAAVDYRQEIADRAVAAAQNAERERLGREQAEREAALKIRREEAADDEAEIIADETVDLGPRVVSVIVKGDAMGSVEAVSMAIQEIGNNEVRARILRSAPGQITESDVDHMATAKGAIVNFNNTIPSHVQQRAAAAGVVILDHNIIYKTVQAVKDLLSAQLTPIYSQRVVAEATVLKVFPINIVKRKFKNIAGAKVTNGNVTRGGLYRVLRDGEEIHKGKLSALKQKQSEVKEVGTGVECGMMFEEFDAFQEGDHIQLYEDVEQKRHL